MGLEGKEKGMNERQQSVADIRVDINNLYREDSITDLKVASIRQLTPIKPDGTRDESREIQFLGHTQLMSQAGLIPLSFEISAKTLAEALEKFPEAVQAGVEKMVEEAKEFQRQEASRIVVPDRETIGKIIT